MLKLLKEQQQLNGDVTTGQVPVGEAITAERNRFEDLLHYLQTGTLPWQVANFGASDLAAAFRATCRDEWLRMQDHLKASREETPFYFRLLQLLTEEEYAQLIGVISGTIPQEFRAVAMQCLTLLLDGKSERVRHNHYTRLSLMAGVLAESIGWQKRSTARSLFKVAVAAVPLHERHLLKKFLAARSRQVALPGGLSLLRELLRPSCRKALAMDCLESCVRNWGRETIRKFDSSIRAFIPKKTENRLFPMILAGNCAPLLLTSCIRCWFSRPDWCCSIHISSDFLKTVA